MEKGYTRDQLIELAVERDAGLGAEFFADAMRHLDQLPDNRLSLVLTGAGRNAEWIRSRFGDWPRNVETGDVWRCDFVP
jgi:hypothetical protein